MARFRSKGTAGKVSGATNEVGALDDKIERLKPNPDAPVQPRTPVHGSVVTAHGAHYRHDTHLKINYQNKLSHCPLQALLDQK